MAADPTRPLRDRLREIADIDAAASVLTWDQAVKMPPGGAGARARVLATLARLRHERWLDAGLERDLRVAEASPPDDDAAALVAVVRRDLERHRRVPSAWVERAARHGSTTYGAWSAARRGGPVAPLLDLTERTLDLTRAYASFFPEAAHPADPWIDAVDEGSTVATLRPLFERLRAELVPRVAAWSQAPDPTPLPSGPYDDAAQFDAALELATAFGYDVRRGRQDTTEHPFAIRFAHGDVRITTRLDPLDLTQVLYSSLHEAGHAMYEQGVDPAWEGTPLAEGVSAGVHESQARLWENQVGRSLAWWHFALPRLRTRFTALEAVTPAAAYRAVNRVRPSLIRTEADEVTYNLHVMIRFDLECALLEGSVSVRDLPEAWASRYAVDLGVTPTGPLDGWLQDVHWFAGSIAGAFQGYALGNLMAAQWFEAAARRLGAGGIDLDDRLAAGDFAPLLGWLRDHVHRHGRAKPVDRLLREATGRGLEIAPFLAYLDRKFAAAGVAA